MSALQGALDCPLDALRSMIRMVIDEVQEYNLDKIVVPVDGSVNSAMAVHIAFQACKHCNATLVLTYGFPSDDEAKKRAEDIVSLHSRFEGMTKAMMETLALPEVQVRPRVASHHAAMGAGEKGLVIDLRDLTDYFIGVPRPSGDELPLFKWLLKTEMEKLGKAAVDWIGANPEEGEDEETTKARQSAIDNCILQQENPAQMDYVLAVILAAKETNCEILFKAHREHAIAPLFRATRRIRGIENFDYNRYRKQFLGQE